MLRIFLVLFVGAAIAQAQTRPASRPMVWGTPTDGIQMGMKNGPDGSLQIEVRNDGLDAVDAENAFIWMLIVQDRERVFFSEKIAWNGEMPVGRISRKEIKLPKVQIFANGRGLKVVAGYPVGDGPPAAAGMIGDVIPAGTVKVRAQLYLPKQAGGILVTSNTISVEQKTEWADMSEKSREALVADLLKQFSRDEFAGKSAHDKAVAIGKEIVPQLLKAADEPGMPDFGRMWLATTLVDIGDERGVKRIIAYLVDPSPGVRYVIAYHGPKMANEKIDKAIIAAAEKNIDQVLAAWAARGFVACHRSFPEKLIQLALESREPRARAEVAAAVAQRAGNSPNDADALVTLIGDQHELVRVAAARATAAAKLKDDRFIGALISALDNKGDNARNAITEALAVLTGEKRTDAEWKRWWAERPVHRP